MTTAPDKVERVISADHVRGPAQGYWAYLDYLKLPNDGKRYEIVDGVLYMAPAPTPWHQEIIGEIFFYLHGYVKLTGHGKVYMAPIDVKLAPDVVVQPDIVILLNEHRDRLAEKCISGTPDLVAEVASPATAQYDRQEKLLTYARAAVPEYWIVDTKTQTVEVLVLEGDRYHSSDILHNEDILHSKAIPGFSAQVKLFFA
jgi:Uma2 family endonuclease